MDISRPFLREVWFVDCSVLVSLLALSVTSKGLVTAYEKAKMETNRKWSLEIKSKFAKLLNWL